LFDSVSVNMYLAGVGLHLAVCL